ncbi:MAG: LysM peptidoglycan-binding domain-containing protein, partial [Humibacillus sp.]|nr:LysM peptidoglycan-binding domain-containing protein [Humibacillus sp.]
MSRLRTLTTGLTALTGLALIIAGTPFLLVALAGNPLPDSVPTISAIGNALARLGGDATILLGLLKYAAWAAWAWFTISAITQTIAQLHQAVAGRKDRTGATLGSTPAARVPRAVDAAWIGRMVAAVLALFTILAVPNISLAAGPAGAAATPGPDTAAAPVATAGPQAGTGHELPARAAAAGGREVTTTETTTVPRTVTIEKGDTLSEVSQEQYGTPGKWPAIFNANRGADQGNGQQLRDPNRIYPGLQVTIPGKSDTVTR